MLEVKIVKAAKSIHKKSVKLANSCLYRRELKAGKRKETANKHAVDLREAAQRTINYSKEVQQDALDEHAKRTSEIQAARDMIKSK